MKNYMKNTMLDLGAFQNSKIAMKKGTHQIFWLSFSWENWAERRSEHSFCEELQPGAPFYGQI